MTDQSTETEAIQSTEISVQEAPSRAPKPPLLANGGRPLAIIPRSFDDAWRIAKMAVAAGWAPRGWKEESAAAAIMHGAEVGLPPMMAMQKICVINGRPSLWGDAVPAIAMATGQLEDWHEEVTGEGDSMVATCTVKRRGFKTPTVRTFSVKDAKAADLWDERPTVGKNVFDKRTKQWSWVPDAPNDSPWHRYQKRMLQMRARVAFRDAFADAFSGLYIAEELQGVPEMLDVTPQFRPIDNPLGPDPIDPTLPPKPLTADDVRFTPGASGGEWTTPGIKETPGAKVVSVEAISCADRDRAIQGAARDAAQGNGDCMVQHYGKDTMIVRTKPTHAPEAAPATQAAPAAKNAPARLARAPGGK